MSNTIPCMTDRRRKRSEKTQQAVTYQLEYVREQYQLDFLAVGDRDGFYVAGAGDEACDSLLAAFAPAISSANVSRRQLLEDELRGYLGELDGSTVEVRAFPIGDQPMYLCAVTSNERGLEDALEHTVTGIERIFRTTKG